MIWLIEFTAPEIWVPFEPSPLDLDSNDNSQYTLNTFVMESAPQRFLVFFTIPNLVEHSSNMHRSQVGLSTHSTDIYDTAFFIISCQKLEKPQLKLCMLTSYISKSWIHNIPTASLYSTKGCWCQTLRLECTTKSLQNLFSFTPL